mgnify:CR=1 FL=1
MRFLDLLSYQGANQDPATCIPQMQAGSLTLDQGDHHGDEDP